MIDNQRTTEEDITNLQVLFLEMLLAAHAEGKDLPDLIREQTRAVKRRLLREKRERAA